MASRLNPIKIGVPALPPIPYPGETNFHQWVHRLYVELDLYFNKMKDQLVDSRGFLLVDRQAIVADGFTIEPAANYVDVLFDGAFTSSTVAAIGTGIGEQQIIITNASGSPASTLTLVGGALIYPVADVVLAQYEFATFRWDQVNKWWTRVIPV